MDKRETESHEAVVDCKPDRERAEGETSCRNGDEGRDPDDELISWIVGVSITDSNRASTPYSGTLNHPAPHIPAQARLWL